MEEMFAKYRWTGCRRKMEDTPKKIKGICRICLTQSDEAFGINATDSTGVTVHTYLTILVPELYIGLTVTPVICSLCIDQLRNAYLLRLRCVHTENCIGIYLRERSPGLLVDLKNVLDYWQDLKSNNKAVFEKVNCELNERLDQFTSRVGKKMLKNSLLCAVLNYCREDADQSKPIKTYGKRKPKTKEPLEEVAVKIGDKELQKTEEPQNVREPSKVNKVKSKTDKSKAPKFIVLKNMSSPEIKATSVIQGSSNEPNKIDDINSGDSFPKSRIRIRPESELKQLLTVNNFDASYEQIDPLAYKSTDPERSLLKSVEPILLMKPKELGPNPFSPEIQPLTTQDIAKEVTENNTESRPFEFVISDVFTEGNNETNRDLDSLEEQIEIKEEPLFCDESFASEMSQSEGETTRSASETSFYEKISGNPPTEVQGLIDEGLIGDIPEFEEDQIDVPQYDVPEYVRINKVSYEDFGVNEAKERLGSLRSCKTEPLRPAAKSSGEKSLFKPVLPRQKRRRSKKRLRLVQVEMEELNCLKKPKIDVPEYVPTTSTIMEDPATQDKNVVVLYTNFSQEGDYINDHDYLISPYRKNKLFSYKENKFLCNCLLCDRAHYEAAHVEHMQTHKTVCHICKVDFKNVFILNLHVKCHTIFCAMCRKQVSYSNSEHHFFKVHGVESEIKKVKNLSTTPKTPKKNDDKLTNSSIKQSEVKLSGPPEDEAPPVAAQIPSHTPERGPFGRRRKHKRRRRRRRGEIIKTDDPNCPTEGATEPDDDSGVEPAKSRSGRTLRSRFKALNDAVLSKIEGIGRKRKPRMPRQETAANIT